MRIEANGIAIAFDGKPILAGASRAFARKWPPAG